MLMKKAHHGPSKRQGGPPSASMIKPAPLKGAVRTNIPIHRYGTPEEFAAVVSFLASPEASYVTRQVIAVNGGLC